MEKPQGPVESDLWLVNSKASRVPVWRTGAYGWEEAAGRASHSFRRMMLNEASPQMCVSILSCLEAESLIGKWLPYPQRQKIIRAFAPSPPYLLQDDSGSPLLQFPATFILPVCLPSAWVGETNGCVIVSYPVALKGMYCLTFRVAVNELPGRDNLWWDVFIWLTGL